jgi:hypothetical protein
MSETMPPADCGERPKAADSYSANPHTDAMDLLAFSRLIWSGRLLIITLTVALVGITAIVSLQLPNIYRSETVLAPASDDTENALSGLPGQLGGLANLAGLKLGGGTVDKTTLSLQVLKSRAFIVNFVRRHHLEVPLLAAEGWDKQNDWKIDNSLYDRNSGKWVRKPNRNGDVTPTDWEIYEEFTEDVLYLYQDKNGIVVVGIELMSPNAAKQWTDWLVQDLNQTMRDRDIAEAQKSIDYLQGQLNETSIAEMKQIFYQLIEEQTKSMMLAQVREEYVFKTLDPAVIPEEKIAPKRALMCIIAGFFGAFIGLCSVVIRSLLTTNPTPQTRVADGNTKSIKRTETN